MTDLMNRADYSRWWQDNTDDDGELLASLPEPVRTLAEHVMALQGRINHLMDPDEHDLQHNAARSGGCRCFLSRCGCAYDHPDAVCTAHRETMP